VRDAIEYFFGFTKFFLIEITNADKWLQESAELKLRDFVFYFMNALKMKWFTKWSSRLRNSLRNFINYEVKNEVASEWRGHGRVAGTSEIQKIRNVDL